MKLEVNYKKKMENHNKKEIKQHALEQLVDQRK